MEVLHANHRAFLSAHRGRIAATDCCLAVASDRPEFTYAVLQQGCAASHIDPSQSTVHLLPGAENEEQNLLRGGYNESGALSYMVLQGDVAAWKVHPDLAVKRASTAEEIDQFTHVQTAAFLDSAEACQEWYPWLVSANQKNRISEEQSFYIGYIDDVPVGVCLIVCSDSVAGVYAVATLPQRRKKGISTTIMKQAILDARQKGIETVALQVTANSYAQSFYKALGFDEQFKARIFKRPA